MTRGARRGCGRALAPSLGLAFLAACGGSGNDGTSGDNPPIKGAPTLEIVGDAFRFDPAQMVVDAERFNVVFSSRDIFHTLVIEDANGDSFIAGARRGETDRRGVELDTGEYVFYCDVPGHRQAGMEGTLTVG